MFFVLSSGRCGSATITHALSQMKNCRCLHHPKPELVLEATEYYCGRYPQEKLAETLRSTRQGDQNGKIYGEVNLQLSLLVPLLNKLYPESKYVWLMRDGRKTVASMFYRGWYDPLRNPNLGVWHLARLQGDQTGDFSTEEWEGMDPFGRCCWIWKKYNQIIHESLDALGSERWRRVQLESLKDSLAEVGPFLGLVPPKKILIEKHNARKQEVVSWANWSEIQRGQFDQICGSSMDQWYPDWRDEDGSWNEIPTEPVDRPGIVLRGKRWFRRKAHQFLKRLDSYVR